MFSGFSTFDSGVPLNRRLQWVWPLLAALVVRLVVWRMLPYHLPNRVPISDEGEYRAAAIWLANGRNFSFFRDWIWTRPPLYLLFVAAHIKLFGPLTLWPIRLSQAFLSVGTVALVMRWAYRVAPIEKRRPAALLAGWGTALNYTLASYTFFVLSETLFLALFFAALLALTAWMQEPRRGALVMAGLLLGAGALTRALLAGALPAIGLLVWWAAARHEPWQDGIRRRAMRGLLAPLMLTLVVSAVILPWSVYNTRFFGAKHLILIDTTGGYNAMFGALSVAERAHIHETLIAIPDHSDRQATAYAAAWHAAGADPARFVQKTLRESVGLLTINFGGIERLYRGYSAGETPVPHLLGLLFDDLAYTLVVPLAVLGLFRRQHKPGKGVAVVWLVFNLLVGALFFSINRFRVPLLPLLIVFAACAVVQWREPWTARARRWMAVATSTALAALLLGSLLWWEPTRGWKGCTGDLCQIGIGIRARLVARLCQQADALVLAGEPTEAQVVVNRGTARKALPCFAPIQARIDQQMGRTAAALTFLHRSADETVTLTNAHVLMVEGDMYRAQGDVKAARDRLVTRPVEQINDLAWAWKHLAPPPTTTINVGNGLDAGMIEGFGGREYSDRTDFFGTGYRWTEAHSRLRFPHAGTGQASVLTLTLNGMRPAGELPAMVTVRQGTQVVGRDHVAPGWTTWSMPLAPTAQGEDVVVALDSSFFVPSPRDSPPDNPLQIRGVMIRRATLGDGKR
ncbi:MAG: glycosyltransferase family 39 protein [Herpetosiphon sp.]